MAAKLVAIGTPVNDEERKAIAHLRKTLPSTFTVIHNFEIRQGSEVFEIDLAILAPHCVFLVDAKGTRGHVDIYGSKWHPTGRLPYYSPLAKLRNHAKVFKSWICDSNPTVTNLRRMHVHQAVLMTARDSNVVDHSGLDGPDVVYLPKSLTYFQDKAHVPTHRDNDIRRNLHRIEATIRGKATPKSAPTTYRNWQVEERLGGTARYTEYRAKHTLMGKRGSMARLRVYQVDPYQDVSTRESERNRISNAFRAVAHMEPHPNILTVRDFFMTENEDRCILVTEDVAGNALSQYIKKASLTLTFDQRLAIMRQVLNALDHAHRFQVIHRNLTPDAILVTKNGAARLTAFDYARVGKDRTSTIAGEITDDLDYSYQAPECWQDPTQASIASDLFSAGLCFYELLVGESPFEDTEQLFDVDAIFPNQPSILRPDLPSGLDGWLQRLCEFDPEDRFASAAVALKALNSAVGPVAKSAEQSEAVAQPAPQKPRDYHSLDRDAQIDDRFIVQERLGKPGGFGVAYKVFDSYNERVRVLKLITKDRRSVFQRLLLEYRALSSMPEHPFIVKTYWADKLTDDTPYIVFDFVEGLDISEMIDADALSLEDAKQIAFQASKGLEHLHAHGVYHQDIKPSNILWTNDGIRLIDFNVAVIEGDERAGAGGTRRYLPPDLDLSLETNAQDKIDRDIYALGITFYECLTGRYPFEGQATPPKKKPIRDPRTIDEFDNLSEELVQLLGKMLAPSRAKRFASASELAMALDGLTNLRQPKAIVTTAIQTLQPLTRGGVTKPNFNPYVSHLLTLYSQSQRTNAGTRGLDAIGDATYVATRLDNKLRPAILNGEFRLVIISGNAGDGKTAFIQKLENTVEANGESVNRKLNGATFSWNGRHFLTNYDGSQDEGDLDNQAVLDSFFSPYQGSDDSKWPAASTQIIAINEGRLVDFLTRHQNKFPYLKAIVESGLSSSLGRSDVAVINLNLRAVVADETVDDSIFDRLLGQLVQPHFWTPCQTCDLKNSCYVHHNAQTLMDPVAGAKVTERLKTLFSLTHLRGQLHITLRDMRSALAYILVGTRNCDDIHDLHNSNDEMSRQTFLNGFYFNAWTGGNGTQDRLLSLLREIDVGLVSNPDLDRAFAFWGPKTLPQSRFGFAARGQYDDDLFNKLFNTLPRPGDVSRLSGAEIKQHRAYVAMLRRRQFFERRDSGWRQMLPYHRAEHFLSLILEADQEKLQAEIEGILQAINRGEGLADPSRLGQRLALRVRDVKRGTIRSYRLFDGEQFQLKRPSIGDVGRFVEYMPQELKLHYLGSNDERAELRINLDIYEMLGRLNNGYRPTLEELQGFYLSLVVFKNVLASAPYQELLLTESGYDFHRIERKSDGVLHMTAVSTESI